MSFFNIITKPTKNIVYDFIKGPNELPRTFKQMLDKIGNDKIQSIIIFRKPLQQSLNVLFNVFTLGEYQKRLNRSPYDNLFHLGILINSNIILEKTQIINLIKYDGKSLNTRGVDFMQINNFPQMTIRQFILNSYNALGRRFLLYDAMSNNCQIFVRDLLKYNNILIPEYETFIMQDVQTIFKNNSTLKGLMSNITNVATRGTYAFTGGSITNSSTLGTTSNNDLNMICNKLGIKLNGIFMSDEILQYLQNGIPDGNYILNLQNSDQDGSHWVSFVKNGITIYYNDSFGCYPDQPLYDVMKRHKYKMVMNKRNNQAYTSSACGYWAIYFLYVLNKLYKNKSLVDKLKAFNSLFVDDVLLNEKILEQKMKPLLK